MASIPRRHRPLALRGDGRFDVDDLDALEICRGILADPQGLRLARGLEQGPDRSRVAPRLARPVMFDPRLDRRDGLLWNLVAVPHGHCPQDGDELFGVVGWEVDRLGEAALEA